MSKLFNNFKKFKNKTALISHTNKKYTYKYVEKKTAHLSSKISKCSIILIITSNSVECILGYISFIRSNNVSILLDENFKIDYIKKIIKKYKPNYIFAQKRFFSKFIFVAQKRINKFQGTTSSFWGDSSTTINME